MTFFDLRPVDPQSDGDCAAVSEVFTAYDLQAYGATEVRTPEQRRHYLVSSPYWQVTHLLATDRASGVPIGVGSAHVPLRENLDNLDLGVSVHPEWRGRGVGTALAEECVKIGGDAGRTKVTWWENVALDGDVDSPEFPANRLARRLGLERRNVSVCRRLDLPLPRGLLDGLAAEAAPYVERSGCEVLIWRGSVPAEHRAAYGALLTQLELDEPDEEIDREVQQFDEERMAMLSKRHEQRGTDLITAVAVAPDGTMVGNSELQFSKEPGTSVVWQENTLVMPDWRGHRLGLAMKTATHRLLSDVLPEATACITWNSHVNDQMIAINERLGYRPIFREIGFQTA